MRATESPIAVRLKPSDEPLRAEWTRMFSFGMRKLSNESSQVFQPW